MRGIGTKLRDPASARSLGALFFWTGALWLVTLWGLSVMGVPAHGQVEAPPAPELYQQHCASCHGTSGNGTYRGPSLVGAGAASADFYLRTGRMPLPHPEAEAKRGPVWFSDEQIRELVDYVASLSPEGPEIPEVNLNDVNLGHGGSLYRLHCAQCHNWDGKGGALAHRENAPELHGTAPTLIAEAVRIGPGTMPVFSEAELSDEEVDDIVAYVDYLERPRDAGGYGLAHWGPTTEAAAAFVILGFLLLVAGWLGERERY